MIEIYGVLGVLGLLGLLIAQAIVLLMIGLLAFKLGKSIASKEAETGLDELRKLLINKVATKVTKVTKATKVTKKLSTATKNK